jgi:hypothetical protein
VSLEQLHEPRAVLDALGRQLVPSFLLAEHADLAHGLQVLERKLEEDRVIIIVDNVESVLTDTSTEAAVDESKRVLPLFETLGRIGATRLLFTSRQALPKPFDGNDLEVGRLEREEARRLIAAVFATLTTSPGSTPRDVEVDALIDAVSGHARSLVLLAPIVLARGVPSTVDQLKSRCKTCGASTRTSGSSLCFASLDVSLRHLSPEERGALRPLAMFQGGGHRMAIARALGVKHDDGAGPLPEKLFALGLMTRVEPGYIRFDPALAPKLLEELSATETDAARGSGSKLRPPWHAFYTTTWRRTPRSSFALDPPTCRI